VTPARFAAVTAAAALAAAGCSVQQMRAQPAATLSVANKAKAYRVGLQLAAQDRARETRHRLAMARVIDAEVIRVRDVTDEGRIQFLLRVRNKSRKPITKLALGLQFRDERGKRLGLLEIDGIPLRVAGYGRAAAWQSVRYTRFGDETANMVLAAHRRKNAEVDVMEVHYADGSQTGSAGDD
jgi:hypothetical protein